MDEFEQWVEMTADPAAAREGWRRWRERCGELPGGAEELAALEQDPPWRKRLLLALGNSPFLTHTLLRWPEMFLDWRRAGVSWRPPTPMSVLAATDKPLSRTETATLLRRYRHQEYVILGILDLGQELPLAEVTARLSETAENTLEACYRWLDHWLASLHGPPRVETPEGRQPARFTILGMGKLGAQELNFSSDIDLILLYDSDEGGCEGGRPISIKAYYTRLGQELIKLMQEHTADGRVFRVDLRLRPEGESGDLCLSVRSAEIYYESWGRTWERAAMIKARPVAGDLALGEEFLARLRPFVYRRYLDYAALDALRELKRRIDRKARQNHPRHFNVKLGRGGIREIEFFAQCHQLIHGGKEPALRQRGTVEILRILVGLGHLRQETMLFLESAYTFLRTVEHRLQIVNDQQTHVLPDDTGEQARVARRCGFATLETFQAELARITGGVHAIFHALFLENEPGQRGTDPVVESLLACDPTQEPILAKLAASGFQDPPQARTRLAALLEGPRGMRVTESNRQWYDRLIPLLLHEVLSSPDQDMALQNGTAFLARINDRVSYLAMLAETPHVLRIIVQLFGSSDFLSHFLNQNPQLLDVLVSRTFLEHYRDRSELGESLASQLAETRGQEERMQALREFKNTEMLRLGIRDLSGMAELSEVMAGLAALADVILGVVLEEAEQDLIARHGRPTWRDAAGERHPAPFAILAMGKLGGGELNYASDLDLIFVHGSQGEEEQTDGGNPIANTLFFTRLAQRVITGVTAVTRGGKLYEIDMRLRPSGHSGPVVTSFHAFSKYQRQEAWTWEHQALTRARVAVGDPDLAHRLREEITAILALPREVEQVRQQVAEMRERMYGDKHPPAGVIDIKQTRGGIVDVEFLVQFLILAHAHHHPRVIQRTLANALLACRKAGLLTQEEWLVLDEAYRFHRLVENRLRLLHNRSENRITPDAMVLRRLHRLCGLEGGESLLAVLERHMAGVRGVCQRHLGG